MKKIITLVLAALLAGCTTTNQIIIDRLEEWVVAEETAQGVVIFLPDVFFDHNSYRLTDQSKSILVKVADTLNIRRVRHRYIWIEGHTDSTGTREYNERLGKLRAVEVKAALVDAGVAADRIDTVSAGEAYPIADNATPEGRAKNRRVEIVVINP